MLCTLNICVAVMLEWKAGGTEATLTSQDDADKCRNISRVMLNLFSRCSGKKKQQHFPSFLFVQAV